MQQAATTMARNAVDYEIIDLASDSDDETSEVFGDDLDFFSAHDEPQHGLEDLPADQDVDHIVQELNARYNPVYEAADGTIDLTGIPDIDVPPSDPIPMDPQIPAQDDDFSDDGPITEALALQMVIDVLPNISIDYVLNLIREKTEGPTRTRAKCHEIITTLLDQETYPKEEDDTNLKKRKRSDDWEEFEKAERDQPHAAYESDTIELLKDEFLNVPVRHIYNVIREHKTLIKSYTVLEEQVRNYQGITNKGFSKIAKARNSRGAENILIERGSQVPKELHAAKRKIESEMAKRRKAQEEERAEADNRLNAQANGRMGECACCFNDIPLNRMISCNGSTTHSYCLECPKRQIETQMGQSNCRPKCFGVDGCEGTFARKDLQQVLSDKTLERLEHLQQQEDLAAAGLDFLSECPFCDFKMECPPVEVDKEFRCQNKKCGKTSCRLCEKETHIPLTCKEANKDEQITLRHIVEEAMSAALIRQCNRCKHPFVKEYGCNKMTCSHCRNVQCYVCSKNVTSYEHFGEVGQKRCPLHENVEDRHEEEVKKAADEAMAKVRADNPALSEADLMIKVSDRVKQAEDARKGRAQAQANGFPYHMVGNQLQHHARPPAVPVEPRQQPAPVAQYVPVHPYAIAPFPVFVPPQAPVQPQPYVQPAQLLHPPPHYQNALYYAAPQPHQPAGYGFNIFPPPHIFGPFGQALPQQQQPQQNHPPLAPHANQPRQQQLNPPPPAPANQPPRRHLQGAPPQVRGVPLNANHLHQRLELLRQLRQAREAQIQVQLNLRRMHLEQADLARGGHVRQQMNVGPTRNTQVQVQVPARNAQRLAEAMRAQQGHPPH